MTWELEYIEPDNYVKITTKGVFSAAKHLDCFKKLFSFPFFKPGMNLLYDNRNFDFDQMNTDKLKIASTNYQKFGPELGEGKMAFLMKSPLEYGIGRQFQSLTEDKLQRAIRVFTVEEEALRWLRKQTPDFQFSR